MSGERKQSRRRVSREEVNPNLAKVVVPCDLHGPHVVWLLTSDQTAGVWAEMLEREVGAR